MTGVQTCALPISSTSYFIGATARRIATKALSNKIKEETARLVAKKGLEEATKEISKQALVNVFGDTFGPTLGALIAWPGFGWALAGLGVIISVLTFKNQRYQQIDYQCNAWQAQTGGDDCELCNNQGLIPCTEYQCKSLGQSCELVNKGTKNEKCVYTNRNDAEYPIIKDRKSTRLNSSHIPLSRMPSSA